MRELKGRILVTGAAGQVGTELTEALRERYGQNQVLASDINDSAAIASRGPFQKLDVLDRAAIFEIFKKENITQVYHLAAILSATGEKKPKVAWNLNMEGLLHIMDACVETGVERLFWPSSIAVFGPGTPRQNTPQDTIMDPNTVYGISKLAGERWCQYYYDNFKLDVRSLRYPGLIGYKAIPGGGTTDYAVEIFHEALKRGTYQCFLNKGTYLPMMYMPDAVKATLELMDAPAQKVKVRSSYNVGALSFAPEEIAAEIQKHIPGFSCEYEADFRQAIAESWPMSMDDSTARKDWGWKPDFDLSAMVEDMLIHLKKMILKTV